MEAVALPGTVLNSLLDWFYPRHCYHCGRHLQDSGARILCGACSKELADGRIVGAKCAICGLPLAGAAVGRLPVPDEAIAGSPLAGEAAGGLPHAGELEAAPLCITCRAEERHFDLARAIVTYAGPASSVIRAFKFGGQFFLGPRFLEAMLDRGWMPPEIGGAELVAPVPLHPRRRRERGYDQALLLARVLAKRLGGKLLPGVLVRTRYTSQQALLPVARRWDNVRGAFGVRDAAKFRGRRVLLVDDVMTTGMTASECARVLKKAGAEHVQVLTLARPAP
jgi:ComF family protein